MTLGDDGRVAEVAATRPLVSAFVERRQTHPDDVALRAKSLGLWREITWAEYADQVERAAMGLLDLGVESGDRILIVGRPTPEWLYLDLAAQSIGALPIAVYATTDEADVASTLAAQSPRVVMVTRGEFLADVPSVLGGHDTVGTVLVGGPNAEFHKADDPSLTTLSELLERGDAARRHAPDRWQREAEGRDVDAPAIVALSAGTKGAAHTVELTSRNLLSAWSWLGRIERPPGVEDRIMSSMCLGHLAERALVQAVPVLFGSVAHFPEDDSTLRQALREISPTIFFGLPHLWETYAAMALDELEAAPRASRGAHHLATSIRARSAEGSDNGLVSLMLRAGGWLSYQGVCRQVLDRFGLRKTRIALTGGAAIAPAVADQWRVWGVPLREFYGGVECAGVAAVGGSNGARRPGLAAIDGVRLDVTADRELVVDGPNVAPSAMASASEQEARGLRTGDVADLKNGVEIAGPLEQRIRMPGGESSDPGLVEVRLRDTRYVAGAIVASGGHRGLGALIEPNFRSLSVWAMASGVPFTSPESLVGRPEVAELFDELVAEVNTTLEQLGSPQVAAYRVVPRRLETSVELTPTRTPRRHVVLRHYAELVESVSAELDGGGNGAPRPADDASGGPIGRVGVGSSEEPSGEWRP